MLPLQVSHYRSGQDLGGHQIQMKILKQLKKVSQRFYLVKDRVAATVQQTTQASTSGLETGKLSTDSVFSCSSKK